MESLLSLKSHQDFWSIDYRGSEAQGSVTEVRGTAHSKILKILLASVCLII
jgi:hypothetical protein